jgi:hypothetical protein
MSANVMGIRITQSSTAFFDISEVVTNNTYFLTQIIYNGTAATNQDKLKLFINGIQRTLEFTNDIPSSIASSSYTPNTTQIGLVSNSFIGNIDEIRAGAYCANSNEPMWRYNNLINKSSYWNVTVQPIVTSVVDLGNKRWQVNGSGFKPETINPKVSVSGMPVVIESGASDSSFVMVESDTIFPGVQTLIVTNSDNEADYVPIVCNTKRTIISGFSVFTNKWVFII